MGTLHLEIDSCNPQIFPNHSGTMICYQSEIRSGKTFNSLHRRVYEVLRLWSNTITDTSALNIIL